MEKYYGINGSINKENHGAEAEARYEAYKGGELEAIDWDEIRKRYERKR
jgi:hypothetical protein